MLAVKHGSAAHAHRFCLLSAPLSVILFLRNYDVLIRNKRLLKFPTCRTHPTDKYFTRITTKRSQQITDSREQIRQMSYLRGKQKGKWQAHRLAGSIPVGRSGFFLTYSPFDPAARRGPDAVEGLEGEAGKERRR